jgi:hypothetical protein
LPPYSASAFEVSCSSPSTCIASGAEGTGQPAPVFVSSTDGGLTWSNAAPPPSFTGIAGISCPAGGTCVIVGRTPAGPATVTRTPGAQWSSVHQASL